VQDDSGAIVVVPQGNETAVRRGEEVPDWARQLQAHQAVDFAHGWLLAVDRGEFGGGLWWASGAGEERKRLLPFNVIELRRTSDGLVLAFAGLAHLDVDQGEIYRLSDTEGRIEVDALGSLDGAPRLTVEEGGAFLAVTDQGVWLVRADAAPSRLLQVDLSRLAPTSVVRTSHGVIYIGLAAFVLRLLPTESGFESEWLLPAACSRLVLKPSGCVCTPSLQVAP
jgi:hypothetical protein